MPGAMKSQLAFNPTLTGISRRRCLILAADAVTGNQIAALLDVSDWCVQLVHSDKRAYERMLQANMDLVIADIDAVDLGGLALLVYCHHHDHSATTYAIAPVNDGYRKKLACALGGCRGFFYLQNGSLNIDLCSGAAAALIGDRGKQEMSRYE